jgi:molecular chaperone GrpE
VASDDTLDAVRDVKSELDALRTLVTERLGTEDPVRAKAFDQLYDELKAYKQDWQFQAEKPLLLDLLLFYDSLHWFLDSLVKQEMSRDVVADSAQLLVDEFLELLYRRDVTPAETSPTFDRTLHKAVQVVDTDDPAKDQAVQQVLKRGFKRGERVLRPEEVIIFRYKKDAP